MMTTRRRTSGAAIAVALIPMLAHPQDSAGKKPLTSAAAIALRTIEALQLSPDGAQLAFVVGEAPKGTGRVRHVWILDMKSGDARQFTASAKSETSPRWAPDG